MNNERCLNAFCGDLAQNNSVFGANRRCVPCALFSSKRFYENCKRIFCRCRSQKSSPAAVLNVVPMLTKIRMFETFVTTTPQYSDLPPYLANASL